LFDTLLNYFYYPTNLLMKAKQMYTELVDFKTQKIFLS